VIDAVQGICILGHGCVIDCWDIGSRETRSGWFLQVDVYCEVAKGSSL